MRTYCPREIRGGKKWGRAAAKKALEKARKVGKKAQAKKLVALHAQLADLD
jgi:hypothetical protein